MVLLVLREPLELQALQVHPEHKVRKELLVQSVQPGLLGRQVLLDNQVFKDYPVRKGSPGFKAPLD